MVNTNGPYGKASPAWYQRLATMSWRETLRTFNPGSLFVVSGAVMVVLAIGNEYVVNKAGNLLAAKKLHASRDEYLERTLPKSKPEFILRWEKEYGSKQQQQ